MINSFLTKRIRQAATIAAAAVTILMITALAACTQTDVVAKYAASSFATVTSRLSVGESTDGLSFLSPVGDSFELTADLSAQWDALLSTAAQPFLAAGLDPAKLPTTDNSLWSIEGDQLVGRFKLAQSGQASSKTAAALIQALAVSARDRISYHAQGKHYGIMLDDFAMLEWAANVEENTKDWILVLDPALVNNAGGQAAAVSDWILAFVPVDGPDGKMIEVEKLLKPINLPK